MNSIDANKVDECILQFKTIINNLDDKFQSILLNLNGINNGISTLNSYNGQDASDPYIKNIISNSNYVSDSGIPIQYFKKIWSIIINNSSFFTDNNFSFILKELETKIALLDILVTKLENSNISIKDYILQLQKQINSSSDSNNQINYNGDIIAFFKELNGNPAWEEIKKVSQESNFKKQNDVIYNLFRSKSGQDDYVDFALDELGNKLLLSTYSTKYAIWYSNYSKIDENNGNVITLNNAELVTPSNEWCAQFVTYVLNNSGNGDKVPSYIECISGSNMAKDYANNGNGEWHSADSDYQPKRGDIFYRKGHTGIVVASDENYIYTIEGNTPQDDGTYYVKDGAENSSGGYVNTRIREKSYVDIGYFSPNVELNYSTKDVTLDSTNYDNIINSKCYDLQSKYEKLKELGGHGSKYNMG